MHEVLIIKEILRHIEFRAEQSTVVDVTTYNKTEIQRILGVLDVASSQDSI